MEARGEFYQSIHTHTHTHTDYPDNYYNPRCLGLMTVQYKVTNTKDFVQRDLAHKDKCSGSSSVTALLLTHFKTTAATVRKN